MKYVTSLKGSAEDEKWTATEDVPFVPLKRIANRIPAVEGAITRENKLELGHPSLLSAQNQLVGLNIHPLPAE